MNERPKYRNITLKLDDQSDEVFDEIVELLTELDITYSDDYLDIDMYVSGRSVLDRLNYRNHRSLNSAKMQSLPQFKLNVGQNTRSINMYRESDLLEFLKTDARINL